MKWVITAVGCVASPAIDTHIWPTSNYQLLALELGQQIIVDLTGITNGSCGFTLSVTPNTNVG